ncbi:MAG: endonuclease/exonuclease/phosphatase family protein [Opitutaceae bacterium]|jgi:endonuclease/exonuclease/phosphatase family metal-dependent hydrolase|nr:endonuclease/exonuclease/phosphatase family protein [Opitutaceae bacterium]
MKHRLPLLLAFALPFLPGAPAAAKPAATGAAVLRVLCYNIHHGEGTDGKLDLERTGRVIKHWNPDLVAVQEVDRGTSRTGRADQAALLAGQLGMGHVFGKTIDYRGGDYGILILSKFPVLKHEMILLPPPGQKEQRGLLVAHIGLPGGKTIRLACTHLSVASAEERAVQTARINELLSGGGAPAILAGDFNARPGSPPMAVIEKHWTDSAAPALKKNATPHRPKRIDYIFFRNGDPFRVIETRTIPDAVTSDHFPILSILSLEQGSL